MSSEASPRRSRRVPFWVAGLASALLGSALQGSLLLDLSREKPASEPPLSCERLVQKPLSEMTEQERAFFESMCRKERVQALRERVDALTPPESDGPGGTIVEVDVADSDPTAPPQETTRLATDTVRTKKETRAPTQASRERSPKPSGSKGETGKPEASSETPTEQEAEPNEKASSSVLSSRDGTGGIVRQDYSVGGALASYKAFGGDGTGSGAGAGAGNSDYLPDVPLGERTVLNANAYRFADFFNKVKAGVQRHWKPSQVYLQRDPTGAVYGVKDRRTVLRLELNEQGEIHSMLTVQASGLDFLDEEARRAFKAAAPFLNPPKGLLNSERLIRFEFGFYFEISGKQRFNWRRL